MSTGAYIPPAPNPYTEERVRAELQKLDRLLDIRWHPGWVWNQRQQCLEGRYLLICYWPPGDKRYSSLDCTHNGETFDILGVFCQDVHNANSVPVSPESMLNVVIELLGKCDGMRKPHLQRIKEIQEHNRTQHERLKKSMMDEALEGAEQARTGVYKPEREVVLENVERSNG